MDIKEVRNLTKAIRQKPPEYFAGIEREDAERHASYVLATVESLIIQAATKGRDSILLSAETATDVTIIQPHFSSLGFEISTSGRFVQEVTISWK